MQKFDLPRSAEGFIDEPSVALENISSFVVGTDKGHQTKKGYTCITLIPTHSYQFELFVDAFLLAQRHKKQKDIIWISSIR